jgi:cold-inducible RNA-binding protein
MSKKLYVGNLSFKIDNDQLKEIFETLGPVEEANVVTDRETGRSRGFGFVTYEKDTDALVAINKISGHEILGRELFVSEARERSDSPRLTPTHLDHGTCRLCGEEAKLIGFEEKVHGVCTRCVKVLSYFLRPKREYNAQ